MNLPAFIAVASSAALVINCAAAPLTLRIQRDAGGVCIIFDTERACTYQLKLSTNLLAWEDCGAAVVGDGLVKTQEVSQIQAPLAFFGVLATETSQVVAPDEWTFTELVLGKMLFAYEMLSETRFSWFGETGEWWYLSFGDDTALLVFTYDEDDNDGAVYREEVVMTFETESQGTYRYSEFNDDAENPSSIITGRFDLSSLSSQGE